MLQYLVNFLRTPTWVGGLVSRKDRPLIIGKKIGAAAAIICTCETCCFFQRIALNSKRDQGTQANQIENQLGE